MNRKTCNGSYCSYKIIGSCYPECSYQGYCDYQTPKGSRLQPLLPVDNLFPHRNEIEEICPYCHLKLSQCKGHTVC